MAASQRIGMAQRRTEKVNTPCREKLHVFAHQGFRIRMAYSLSCRLPVKRSHLSMATWT